MIWDRGHWQPLADPDRGLADGKLDFELHGERLRGRWTLVRMAQRDGAQAGGELAVDQTLGQRRARSRIAEEAHALG